MRTIESGACEASDGPSAVWMVSMNGGGDRMTGPREMDGCWRFLVLAEAINEAAALGCRLNIFIYFWWVDPRFAIVASEVCFPAGRGGGDMQCHGRGRRVCRC